MGPDWDWFEVLWLCVSCCAFLAAAVALREALYDRAVIRARGVDGPVRIIAEKAVKFEAVRLLMAVLIALCAMAATYVPTTDGTARLVAKSAVLGVACLLFYSCLVSLSARRQLSALCHVTREPSEADASAQLAAHEA